MGARISAFDWRTTPLGPMGDWPVSLTTIVGFVVRSQVPMILLWGEAGVMLYNDSYAQFAGGRHPSLLGMPVRDGWPEVADFNDNVMRCGLRGETLKYRDQQLTLYRSGSPETVWLDLDYSPVFDESGQPAGVMAIVGETTDRVRNARALKESEAQFRVFAQAMPNQVWAARPDGFLYWLNDQAYSYNGAAAGSLTGLTAWGEVVHPDDLPAAAARWATSLENGIPYQTEFRLRRYDGAYRWFLARAEPVRGDDGAVVGWVGTNTDVHYRREVEDALRTVNETLEEQVAARTAELRGKEARLRAIFETSFGLQGLLDRAGIVLDANRTALDVVGAELSDVLGQPFWETPWVAATPGLSEQMREAVARVADAQVVRQEVFANLPVGGWRWFDLVLRPIADLDGGVLSIALEAVETTERRAAEAALRQAQKLEAMGQLTGGVAHDFNNLLTPIIGTFDMLQRREIGSEREQRLIRGGLQSAERAKTLVQRLLAFARRQPLQPRPVDVAGLIESMGDLVVSTSGPRIRVNVAIDESIPAAVAEVNQLEMAILNLAVNARDAMPDGGTLTIAAKSRQVAEGEHPALPPGRYVGITVSDTGIGMDDETRMRAIEPFFSTKGVGKGTGLGLSMVHGLTSQLGGALDIASKPGLGTTIDLLLPAAESVARQGGGDEAPATLPSVRARVLLVDDELPVRAATAEMLVELGYTLVEADSGEEALNLLAREAVDLVVTDHLMSGITGMALVERLRQERPELPVLIVTGYADVAELGADVPRLTKPFRLAELAEALQSLRPA